jgi:metal-responsive CopG/Arc/MetJ family transcriptional regulator
MKKKVFVRPVSVSLSEEVFKQIYEITEKEEISLSDYIREAIQEKLKNECEHSNTGNDTKL